MNGKSSLKRRFEKDHKFFLGFDKVAEILIQKGANVNSVGPLGTALTLATKKGMKHSF